jgi:hypothetical protein
VNAGNDLAPVSVGKHHPALSATRRSLHRSRRSRDFVQRRLPEMMLGLLALNPHTRLREEIDAVEVIPMHVRDDDVGDTGFTPARATASLGGKSVGRQHDQASR